MKTQYPWTVDNEPNLAISDQWVKYYTIRWNGCVRGQICSYDMANRIVVQLNIADITGLVESPIGRF